MKTQQRLASAVLVVAMLLSLFGGSYTSAAAAQSGTTTVTTDSELAYAPLTQTAGIAYEQHEDGYAVSLDRAADSVTMNITGVPGDAGSRTAEKARLYIRTGVTLKANTAYRVSFSLRAEHAQPDYTVCFDSASKAAAFGTLEGRSIEAGSTDQVKYQINPQAEQGELVLRLLLGKTDAAGNALRFSDLAVEEVTGTEVGKNAVLADSLNLNTPGFIRSWAHTDSGATVTCDDDSVTMTITKTPGKDAEVWKIKLFIATGLNPAPGKMYHFTADAVSTAPGAYELCVNENDTEKGFGAFYSQSLSGRPQKLDYIVYVSSDKANPGELIFQFSLGNLKTGTKVTLSNVALTEVIPTYTDVLSEDFVFTDKNVRIGTDSYINSSDTRDVTKPINWSGTSTATTSGDFASALSVQDDSAIMEITDSKNPWEAMLNINTNWTLSAGVTYHVSFDVRALKPYSKEAAVLYGTGFAGDTWDNDQAYGGIWGLKLGTDWQTISYQIKPESSGNLMFTIQAGAIDGSYNEVTVRNVQLEELSLGDNAELAKVIYPTVSEESSAPPATAGSFRVRDNHGSITGDGKSATMTCEKEGNTWERGMFIDDICALSAGTEYEVRFDIVTDGQEFNFNVCYSRNDHFGAGQEKYFGEKRALTASSALETIRYTITPKEEGGKLFLFLEFPEAETGTEVTVSNIQVVKSSQEPPSGEVDLVLNYPSGGDNGSFRVRDNHGSIVSTDDGESATMICEKEGNPWERGMFIDNICELSAGAEYEVRFDVVTDGQEFDFNVCYSRNDHFGEGQEKYFGEKRGLTASSTVETFSYTITPKEEGGKLFLFLEFPEAETGTEVTVSNIQVEMTGGNPEPPAGDVSLNVTYPNSGAGSGSGGSTVSKGSFDVRDNHGSITGDGNSATMTCEKAGEAWERGMFINNICDLIAGTKYEVCFDIETDGQEFDYKVHYNRNSHFGDEQENDFGIKEESASLTSHTVTETIIPERSGKLLLFLEFSDADTGTKVTVSNISVKGPGLVPTPGTEVSIDSYTGVWAEGVDGYTVDLTRNSNNAVLKVTKPADVGIEAWKAKLYIRTGLTYDLDTAYRARFDITAENEVKEFCVISKGIPDSEDIRGTWGLKLGAGETKTITTRAIPVGTGSGEFNLQIELGNFVGAENTYTISNVRVEEVKFSYDYVTSLSCRGSSASLSIKDTPADYMQEFWKLKMFVDTGVYMFKDETYRVTFDVWAPHDIDFEVNYNRYVKNIKEGTRTDDIESGFGSVYGLHAAANKETSVEHIISVSNDGTLELQLMLGKIPDPNVVSVRNLKIERVDYSDGKGSALPSKPVYQEPSAVSYWAHEDYTVNFDGTDKAITANITGTPAKGAEPWKIKLFLDTGVVLEKGRYYKVTAKVKARSTQDYEICYNNGGIEMGYDALGGLRVTGGEKQTIERIVSVPADKNDTNNLMLQINLGKTTSPNAVTVSDVKVEEVSLSYANMMAKNFAYTQGGTVDLWTYTDYTANYEAGDGKATAHITQAPETGAEVWKVKLFVNTGAMLSAGKTYLVRADMLAAKSQNYEVCFNNEETEKGFDAMYGQYIEGGTKTTVERKISVPASMTDAGQLVLQFAVGGPVTNDITVSNVSVQELNFGGGSGNPAPGTVVSLYNAPNTAAGTLAVTREKLAYQMTKISPVTGENAIRIQGANLRSGDLYTVAFTARADKNLTGTFALNQAGGRTAAINQPFSLTTKATQYSFTTSAQLTEGGAYDLLWQFSSPENQKAGSANVEISNITVYSPPETLTITRDKQNVTVNGKTVTPDTYNINGNNYVKLRDLALLLNDTNAQFAVRYHSQNKQISLTTGKAYTPIGGELTAGQDRSASCRRGAANITVNGKPVNLKAYNFGGNNFFRLRDLDELLGFKVEYVAETNTAAITSPPTPEAQEKGHAYDLFFLPEVDGEAQPYVGDTMPFYEDGVYYIYYLKDGGDAYNHSVYVATTTDFVRYTEFDDPVLSASREDVQDSWIGTGSVVKIDGTYYFFYTGFNSSGSQEYHEKVMVAKSSSPTTPFEKVSGWEIVPPDSLGQKNDFRDPQAYYDPTNKTISLTITAGQDGAARILKYTLSKDLKSANYDGIIYTDPTGDFWNMECSDTFRIGNKWYLTYSGQDDTLWYAMANSRFGPYTNPTRLDGKLFYAAKHVEDGENTYMVGWARRANSASSTEEVNGWAGNVAVQKLNQQPDGTLTLVPVDSIVSAFSSQQETSAPDASLTAGSAYSYKEIFTTSESFMLSGEFTYTGTGSFGLAFDFNGKQEQYKLVALDPAANKLRLSFNEGKTLITETQAPLSANQKHTFTYIQDGSIGIFYLDDQASLLVRVYGATDKPIYLFAENNNVTFTSLRQFTR